MGRVSGEYQVSGGEKPEALKGQVVIGIIYVITQEKGW